MMRQLDPGHRELDVFAGHVAGLSRLVREIHNAKMGLNQASSTRAGRGAASGITKAELRQRLARLEGMLASYAYVTGRWDQAGRVTDGRLQAITRELFGFSLGKLRQHVEDS